MTDRQFERRIKLIQQGDRQGLKEIYGEYGKMIYQCAFQVLRNRQDAEDVTSDFFLKLWNIADTYCFGGKHKRWLVTIARNMALDLVKKKSRERLAEDGEDFGGDTADTVSTEETVTGKIAVAEALERLDESEREIVNMKIFAGMTFRDIAEVLEKPIGTVTWKYRNALAKMREFIGEVYSA
ncbi:MAG: sigma-70 family RNA polymerase sigma factor [Ruminococcus sp.]|nr:sigma-70 family RNA polymerase sigma factor [Ruminococcus sp.]MCM1380519.1 sigma-70 family RNA polymerase sigma factor [Muribaculaceae bacterium]MCM1478663.1 sigma-70 family RNA polymerase sigma factor [Muribaculaceae bacterium]